MKNKTSLTNFENGLSNRSELTKQSVSENLISESSLFVVLGMHRSGTSLTAASLEVFDIYLGENLLGGMRGDNEKGFYEDQDILKLNEDILKEINSCWDGMRVISGETIQEIVGKGYLIRAISLIRKKLTNKVNFGFKDPRVARLLKFWNLVFKGCNLRVNYIVVIRNPLSVAISLEKRNFFPLEKSYYLWAVNTIEILEGIENGNAFFLAYEDFLSNPREKLLKLSKLFNLNISKDKLKYFFSDVFDLSLSHSLFNENDLLLDPRCPALVRDIYHAITLAISKDPSSVYFQLDEKIKSWKIELCNIKPLLNLGDKLSGDLGITSERLSLIRGDWEQATDHINHLNHFLAKRDTEIAVLDEKEKALALLLQERDTEITVLDEKEKALALLLQEREVENHTLIHKNQSLSTKLMRMTLPISVITVNYNGKKYLDQLICSIKLQSMTPLEIIVVDNASTDGSDEYIKKNYPEIRLIKSDVNLGFAGGNNLGVKNSNGDFIALINNDTIPDPQWLENSYISWMKKNYWEKKVGAISPKIKFLKKFLNFEIESEVFAPDNGDSRPLGVAVGMSCLEVKGANYQKILNMSGFYPEENWGGDLRVRWTSGSAKFMLPIDDLCKPDQNFMLKIQITSGQENRNTFVKIKCNEEIISELSINDSLLTHEIIISENLVKKSKWVINNAGTKVDEWGQASDIGINEFDNGQYDEGRNIDAFCGCAVFIPKKTYEIFGGFDEKYFMYFEDVDLSIRMVKKGFPIYYEPTAVIRHIHAGTSVEGSPHFNYYVTRNFWVNSIKNSKWPNKIVIIFRYIYTLLKENLRKSAVKKPLNDSLRLLIFNENCYL